LREWIEWARSGIIADYSGDNVMRFDLVDLNLFTHIAEASSLTRGAERCHLSLPAASTRIKNLEEQVASSC
jgi:poly-gamma-glutamate capsule biosynthesis protein CapA/YwtB (metallophosphatase superfamily)